jgi:hypothetical protein
MASLYAMSFMDNVSSRSHFLPLFNRENLGRYIDSVGDVAPECREIALCLVNEFDGDVDTLLEISKKLSN